jgi:hypothetical protein
MATRGTTTPDITGGPKIFRAEALSALALTHSDWFLDCEAVCKAEAAGMRIEDVPAVMRARTAGVSKVNWATAVEFVDNIARYRLSGWK